MAEIVFTYIKQVLARILDVACVCAQWGGAVFVDFSTKLKRYWP